MNRIESQMIGVSTMFRLVVFVMIDVCVGVLF